MHSHNDGQPAPNAERVNQTIAALKRLRQSGVLVVGWGDDQIPPMWATKLEKAGLARVEVVDRVKRVYPV